MTTNITPVTFPSAVRESESNAQVNVRTLHAALGAFILLVEQHLPADKHEMFHAHAVDIDNAVNTLFADHRTLLSSIAALSAYAQEIKLQRDNSLYELKDALDRADEAEHTASANIYQRLLYNIEKEFNCERRIADKILCALWDEYADVDAETANVFDTIANIIGGY